MFDNNKRTVPLKEQLKFGMIHPLKAFLITIKNENFDKHSRGNIDTECMPFGIMIDITLLAYIFFLLKSKLDFFILLFMPLASFILVCLIGIYASVAYFIYTIIKDWLHRK